MPANQTDFTAYLHQSAKEIQTELKRISKDLQKQTAKDFQEIELLTRRFTESFFGGKMLRGTLVRLGYELVNNKPTKAIYQAGAAFEILHTALLIHDDIIDQSPTRRGKPALHVHANKHYGISQALCLGDLGITLASKLISESNFPPDRKNQAVSYFLKIVNDTILGEMLDVESTLSFHRTEKQIFQIQKMKTANYTITGPLTLGAILAGASNGVLNKLKEFGEPLGIAYQIQDDILGIFGEEKIVGKSVTSDIEENKSTLLISHALKHTNKSQLNLLKAHYGKKGITKKGQEEIKKIFIETDALLYSQNKIEELTSEAKTFIRQLTSDKIERRYLTHLCDLLVKRNA